MTDENGRSGMPPGQQWPQQPVPAQDASGYGQPGWDQPAPGPQSWGPPAGEAGYPQGGAPEGYPPPGYPQQGYPQQGYPQQPPPGYPPGQPAAAYGPGGPGGPGGPLGWAAPGAGGPPPPRRKRWPIVTALVAVLVVAAGVVVGITVFGGANGGAKTPTEAVNLLAQDLVTDDYLGAIGMLHPAEASLAADLSTVVTDQLKRLDVLKPDADPRAALGSLTFSDLKFDEATQEKVRDNVVINKLVAGRITVNSDSSTLPFTDSFKAKAFPNGVPAAGVPSTIDIAEEVAEQGGEPIRIASVDVEGKWYVSLFYTVADYALKESGTPWPTTAIAAKGAASGEDALKETVQAVLDQDAQRLVELAPPTELAVVHDAGPAIVQAAGAGQPSGAKILTLDTTEQNVRGHTALTLDKLVVDAGGGSQFSLTRSGDCVTIDAGTGGNQQLCASQLTDAFGSELAGLPPAVERVVPKLAKALLDVKVIVVQDDGSWYVSPSQTVVQLYADLLGAFDAQDISDLIAAAPR